MIFKLFITNPLKIEIPYHFPKELDFKRFVKVFSENSEKIEYSILSSRTNNENTNKIFSISIDEFYKNKIIKITISAPIAIQNDFNRDLILIIKKNMDFLNLMRKTFDFKSPFTQKPLIHSNQIGILGNYFSIHSAPYNMPMDTSILTQSILTQNEKDLFDIIFRKISSKITISNLENNIEIMQSAPYLMIFYYSDFDINRVSLSLNANHTSYNLDNNLKIKILLYFK